MQFIPVEIPSEYVEKLFGQFEGFATVSHIQQKGLAFVKFDSIDAAVTAQKGMHGFQVEKQRKISVIFVNNE